MASIKYWHVLRNYSNFYQINRNLLRCCNSSVYQGFRHLYSAEFLGIDNFRRQKEKTGNQFGDMKEKFIDKMVQYLSNEKDTLVFTEDLKNMVYLSEGNEHLDMCIKMMKRFHKQNKELRFGTFIFGPIAMRLFYHMDKPDIMLNCLNDEELEGFFDQLSSYQIAMDLLFVKERYEDVINIYKILQSKQLLGTKYPRECVILVMGSCYKLNTPESYEYAISLIKSCREVGANILWRGLAFAAALALNQNHPQIAVEILSLSPHLYYSAIKNLRIISLAQLDRLESALSELRSVVDQDVPIFAKKEGEILQYTIDKVQESVNKLDNKEMSQVFEVVHQALIENNHIKQISLDELLCLPIVHKQQPFQNQKQTFSRGPYIGYNVPRHPGSSRIVPISNRNKFPLHQRQGLTDVDD